jgi:hypothetical protein
MDTNNGKSTDSAGRQEMLQMWAVAPFFTE